MHQNKKLAIVILVVLVATISIASVTYVYVSGFNPLYEYDNSIDDSPTNSNYWEDKFYAKVDEYYDLAENYNNLRIEYDNLADDYKELAENSGSATYVVDYTDLSTPTTLIKNGTIYWLFEKLDGSISQWNVDIDTYRQYINYPEPTDNNLLYNSDTGETYTVRNLSKFVQPEFFEKVISGLTKGKSDVEFVAEVINLKNQLISYGSGLGDQYRWSAETLTEARGQCGDICILMASLLKAGEEEKNYGLDVYIWYCDANHITEPQEVNHAIIGVEFQDGSGYLIEATSDIIYYHEAIVGWKYKA